MKKRKSIRLKGYDYSQDGEYFVTICTQNKRHYFGRIENGKMILNECGKMIAKWWDVLPTKFLNIICDDFVIMPNHIHGIIKILNMGGHVNSTNRTGGHVDDAHSNCAGGHVGPPLHAVVQWFKTMSTNEYIRNVKMNNWARFDKRLWQRNYYEHIIRNDNALEKIREYIANNPKNFISDRFHTP